MRKGRFLAISVIFVSLVTVMDIEAQEEEFVNEDNCDLDSESLLNEILTHDPENFDAWYDGGIMLHNCGQYDIASTFFSAAIGIDPEHDQAKKYDELNEQKLVAQREAQEQESNIIELILEIGLGIGIIAVILWYYGKKKKSSKL